MTNILLARQVNQALGGPFVAPWDIDDLPDDFIDAAKAFANDLPAMAQGKRKEQEIFTAFRNAHPNYARKH